jgi:hypothetical protein
MSAIPETRSVQAAVKAQLCSTPLAAATTAIALVSVALAGCGAESNTSSSDSSAWELQFGGHHLGINATLDASADAITFAPTHLGSQPSVYTDADGNEVQPLAGMYETAFAFYDSLTDEQKQLLLEVIANWVGLLSDEQTTTDALAKIEATQQGSAGADVDGVITAGWGHIHTIYRDPTNDYANSATQQEASGMAGANAPVHWTTRN